MFDVIRLPEEVEQGAQGGPSFQTSIVGLSGGNEQRNQDWEFPRQTWDIGYGIQDQVGYNVVRDFFYARRAQANGFLFKDWSDFTVTDQLLGTGDGTTRTFLLVRTYETTGPNVYTRRVTRPVAGTLTVKIAGVPSLDFTSGDGGWIRFNPGFAPALGAQVTASFEFDVPVRFTVDSFPLKLDWQNAAEIASVPIIETRDEFNAAPTAVNLSNTTTSMAENTSTVTHVHVADISVDDDPFGIDNLTLTGADAALFEIVGTIGTDRDGASLYIKAGTVLDFELHPTLNVTVNVDDPDVAGSHPQAFANLTINLTDVNEPPSISLTGTTVVFADGTSTASPLDVGHVRVLDDALGLHAVTLSGPDAASFQLSGSLTHTGTDAPTGFGIYTGITLQTVAGLDYSVQKTFSCVVNVADSGLPSPPQGTVSFSVTFGVVPGSFNDTVPGTRNLTVPNYTTLVITMWGPGGGGEGYNTTGTDGVDTTIPSLGLTAGAGKAPVFGSGLGGIAGVAIGGDTNTDGKPGGNGLDYKKTISRTETGSYSPGSFRFSTPPGGNNGDNANGAPTTAGAVYTFVWPTVSVINVNGAAAAGRGGGGAGGIQYGTQSQTDQGGFLLLGTFAHAGPGGAGGAKTVKTYTYNVTPGFPVPGASLSYTVGAKGVGGISFANGGDGGDGEIDFSWT